MLTGPVTRQIDFRCTALNEWVAVGRRPISKNASKMLQKKSGGQEALPQALSDIRCVFEWHCPPVLVATPPNCAKFSAGNPRNAAPSAWGFTWALLSGVT